MATVYLAEDRVNRRRVAIKVLRPEIAAALGAERFLREIEVTANLDHPHILPLFDSGEARVPPLRNTERGTGGEAFLYYVMPYVEGESLRDRLNRDKQLPVEEAAEIAREVATALGYAHARGIVHRDIKPENILLSAGLARVADFGIAKAIDEAGGTALTQTGAIVGTAPYVSPEQAGGELELDGRSDLYALGCVLHEMLAGQPPFTGATVESLVRQHLASAPRPVTEFRPSIPQSVAQAVATCLAKTPADRYRTASDLVAALGSTESSTPTSPPAPTRGRRWRAVAAGLGIVAAVLGGWWWLGASGSGDGASATSGPSWVIVAEFDGTVDEGTREVARRQVSAVIDESGTFLTVQPSQLAVGLGLAMKPETTRVDVDVARELAERGGFGTVVAGTVDRLGEVYTVQLRGLNPADGAALATRSVQALGEGALIETFAQAGSALVEDLERRSDLVLSARREITAMTPSLDAFRLFVEADRLFSEDADYRGAVEPLEEALAIDSTFALAWRLLSNAYVTVQPDSAASAIAKALRYRERLTDDQRLAVEADYAELADTASPWRDRLGRSLRLIDRAVQVNSGDPTLHRSLARFLSLAGRHGEALAALNRADSLLPFGLPPWLRGNRVSWGYLPMGRYEEAWAELPHTPRLAAEGGIQLLLLAEQRWDEALDSAKTHLDNPAVPRFRERRAARVAASALAARGRIGEARSLLNAYDWTSVQLALVTRPGSNNGAIKFSDSVTGDFTEAFAPLENASTDLRSMLEGQRWREVITAIEGIMDGRRSQRHDWLRAEAYQRLDRPDSAVAAFERVLDPTNRDWQAHAVHGLYYPYAHRRLALLYEQLDQPDQAEDHWAIFLDTVTRPDPEIQWMVNEAREHLEELARGR